MNPNLKETLKPFVNAILRPLTRLGFDPWRVTSYKYYFRYRKERKEWLKKGGKIARDYMILYDYEDKAGVAKGHYFHQDLLVAKLIHEHNPKRHVDIASRIDGLVAHIASYREVEVFDIRHLPKSKHENILFKQADLMNPHNSESVDSVSCLHAIEHFGLGRYTDEIDINGHIKGITNLVNLVSNGGRLYISFPIGKDDEVHFNAHRVFRKDMILQHPEIKKSMELVRFDYVDDLGELHLNKTLDGVKPDTKFGCGIYTFEKLNNINNI
jgi:hypothetical protein